MYKKLVILILAFSGILLFSAERIKILKPISLRSKPSILNNEPFMYLPKGDIYDVIGTKISWHKVKILDGDKHEDVIGWIYARGLDVQKVAGVEIGIVLNQGCTLRKEPYVSKKTEICYIKAKAKVEILDEKFKHCMVGQMGEIYFTTLHNYSMPLIRYEIGDTAIVSEKKVCSCKRGWPLIRSVTGRTSNHFKTRDGGIVHGEYFTHLFYGKDEIRKFQVMWI